MHRVIVPVSLMMRFGPDETLPCQPHTRPPSTQPDRGKSVDRSCRQRRRGLFPRSFDNVTTLLPIDFVTKKQAKVTMARISFSLQPVSNPRRTRKNREANGLWFDVAAWLQEPNTPRRLTTAAAQDWEDDQILRRLRNQPKAPWDPNFPGPSGSHRWALSLISDPKPSKKAWSRRKTARFKWRG
jgi:hypothetical protein